jgi:hypothetical protein
MTSFMASESLRAAMSQMPETALLIELINAPENASMDLRAEGQSGPANANTSNGGG